MPPKLLFVGLLLVACSRKVPEPPPKAPVLTTYEQELSQAKWRLQGLSKSDPSYPEAAFALCVVHYRSAKELRAKEVELQDSLGALTSSPISNERFEEAARCLSAHTKDHPDYPKRDEALFLSGDSFYSYQQAEAARQSFLELVKNYPTSDRIPDVYFLFGEYYFRTKDIQTAKNFYEKVLAFPGSPLSGAASYQLGWCHFNLASYQEAMKQFMQALSYARAHAEEKESKALEQRALKALVIAYAQIGAAEKAPAFFEKLSPNQDTTPLLRELFGQYQALGKAPEAAALCADYAAKHNGDLLETGCKK